MLQEAIAGAAQPVTVLPAERSLRESTLVRLQVTNRSALGALALETGGMLIDHGWLRVLGGGEPPLNLAAANGLNQPAGKPPPQLLVAYDILGGKYAINGDGLPRSDGQICYFAPDELAWIGMEMGHAEFILWTLTDRLAQFNEHLRWEGWERETATLALDQGISVYPFPFTEQGKDLNQVSRRPVPIHELLDIWEHLAAELDDVPDGGSVAFRLGN